MSGKDSKETHKLGEDGVLQDGVPHYVASPEKLQTYQDASQALSHFQVPVLFDDTRLGANNRPCDRLYVAAFDGTSNDKDKDPLHATNVAKIADQIAASTGNNGHIQVGYFAGPGTQDNGATRLFDSARGHTYDKRLEQMYKQFTDQAWEWKRDNPDAEIRVACIGFSRGAEQAAGFARLVHERGIQDPTGARYTFGFDGLITDAKYNNPALVEPKQVAQVEGLFDAVGTGTPYKRDRRPPPSVISGIHIIAADERRGTFPSDRIIRPGLSPDGRFLGLTVAGAHSDIGGSYHRDGLAARSHNLMTDYLNGLSNRPFLAKSVEPDNPSLNVIHRSEESALFKLLSKVDRSKPEGQHDLLVPKSQAKDIDRPMLAEPRDDELNRQFRRQAVGIQPVPPATTLLSHSEHPDHALYQQARAAVHRLDTQLGHKPDERSDRLAASLTVSAQKKGLTQIDHVVLSDNNRPGSYAFAVQGELNSALNKLAKVNTDQAVKTTIEQSSRAWQRQANEAQAGQPVQAQQEQAPTRAPQQR
ncbi:T6SS phospholipase effector Tle1-like catalytic domain-containing protein [Dyella tabacisoli]|uniref:DUF2235 domain-containing protein n=1 Tax=Dyella tabacisoli TaxID=2282381 RepID=A0A369URD5_9GAMM|nr:DUF2235 domain-containing protein [Dyella tabacisoli]RDD82298.1 DUF2235 domain-containing protein [Dyella tabacisoli]